MGNDLLRGPTLVGIVEVDETLVGGKTKGKGAGLQGQQDMGRGSHTERRQRAPGAHSRREAGHTPSTPSSPRPLETKQKAIYTDELKSYLGIADDDTRHETVRHSAEEWVVGDVHTNSIENVWSLFKRSIMGAFHKISRKHLDRYLEELEWRFNNRDNPYIFRDTLARIMNTDPLEYKRLVA